MTKSGLSPSLTGTLLIGAVLAALVFGPRLLTKTSFKLDGTVLPKPQRETFPLGEPLQDLRAGAKKTVTLQELAAANPGGLLVNFWATWCPPCVEELPSLESLHRQLVARKKEGLPQLVSISVDEKAADVPAFLKSLDFTVSFPLLFDDQAGFSRSVGTTKFPETYWVTDKGKILHKWIGPQNWLAAEVIGVLDRKNPAR